MRFYMYTHDFFLQIHVKMSKIFNFVTSKPLLTLLQYKVKKTATYLKKWHFSLQSFTFFQGRHIETSKCFDNLLSTTKNRNTAQKEHISKSFLAKIDVEKQSKFVSV